jgi:hypothetical protein
MALVHNFKEALMKAGKSFHEICDSLIKVFRDKTLNKDKISRIIIAAKELKNPALQGLPVFKMEGHLLLFLPLQKSLKTPALIF